MKAIIDAKREVFYDMRIPWDMAIERKFAESLSRFPNGNPEIILDNIASSYIERALSHPLETYAAWLKEQYGNSSLSMRRIRSKLGKEIFKELAESG